MKIRKAIASVVLGYMALGQIRRTGERGHGMATTGLVLGWLGIAFFVLMVAGFAAMASTHGGINVQVAPVPGSP